MDSILSAVRIINAVAIELFTLIAARRRRRRMILHMLRTQIAANSIPRRPPYIWERARSREFFFHLVKAHFSDQLWVENFRLTRSGFEELSQLIGPAVSPASVLLPKACPHRRAHCYSAL